MAQHFPRDRNTTAAGTRETRRVQGKDPRRLPHYDETGRWQESAAQIDDDIRSRFEHGAPRDFNPGDAYPGPQRHHK